MKSKGLKQAREKMAAEGVDQVAIEVFSHYYRQIEHGETGMIAEDTIDPLDMESLADVEVADDVAAEAVGATVVIKLNGGLGTSMGMARAKSLLCVRRGLSFLDVIARQVLHLRREYGATLPLVFMNSFRTSGDTLAALARYDDLEVDGLPLEFLQNKEPKLREDDLTPVGWTARPVAGVVSARPRRPLHRAGGHRPAGPAASTPATATRSSPTPTTSARSRTPGSPAGSPSPVRRSRSRRCGVRPRTARAATSRAARPTAGSCCARPRRPPKADKEALQDLVAPPVLLDQQPVVRPRPDARPRCSGATACSACR